MPEITSDKIFQIFKPKPATIQQTEPSEPIKALQVEDVERVVQESILHPMRAIEHLVKLQDATVRILDELVRDNLIKRQVHDDVALLGATLNYQLKYNRHLYVYVYCTTSFTIVGSNSFSTPVQANYWTLLNWPEGTMLTVQGGSDSAPLLCTFRTCDAPMDNSILSVLNSQAADSSGTFTNATATNSVTANNLDGMGNALISIKGTYTGASGVFEASDDGGTTWFPVQLTRDDSAVTELGYTLLSNTLRTWEFSMPGFDAFRVRSTAVATGTVTVNISPSAEATANGANVNVTNASLFGFSSDYPTNAAPITSSSGNVANAAATATLTGVAAQFTWLTGFEVTGTGSTAGSVVVVTVTGTVGGTLSYVYAATTGALLENTPLLIEFTKPIRSSAVLTNIVVSVPALGAGNTNSAVVAHGYTL